ncbi:tail terminator [Microbacterium phage Caron]|uniref:Tail terminator n=1 Tax=Microbacterium phage Caron TaxID=3028494 RepID=A0AAE9ZNT1_9CAUD|nr:tail terminator [Microbacterium phage Caron]
MTDPIIFDDPQRATRDILRDVLPAYGIDATVSTRRPEHDLAAGPRKLHIRVRSGTPIRARRVASTATVRLTTYGTDEGDSMRVAAIVEAVLLSEVSSDSVLGFGPVSGPVPGTDQDTGDPIALVTVQARLKPRHLRKD